MGPAPIRLPPGANSRGQVGFSHLMRYAYNDAETGTAIAVTRDGAARLTIRQRSRVLAQWPKDDGWPMRVCRRIALLRRQVKQLAAIAEKRARENSAENLRRARHARVVRRGCERPIRFGREAAS